MNARYLIIEHDVRIDCGLPLDREIVLTSSFERRETAPIERDYEPEYAQMDLDQKDADLGGSAGFGKGGYDYE